MEQVEPKLNKKLISPETEEYYNAIRTNILFSGKDLKVIAVTSTKDNEGKSTVAMNIAASLAALGKRTLLIDADTRNSVFVGRMKIRSKVVGLTHYLAGEATVKEIVFGTTEPNLHMILSGQVPPNPTALLQGEAFQELIDVCRHHYDYVIVDTPPLGLVTDASIIAHQCDASILVIEAGAIKRRAVKKIQERLEQTGAKFLGVVLNKVDVKANHYGAYGAYGSYGNYGNYGKKAE